MPFAGVSQELSDMFFTKPASTYYGKCRIQCHNNFDAKVQRSRSGTAEDKGLAKASLSTLWVE